MTDKKKKELRRQLRILTIKAKLLPMSEEKREDLLTQIFRTRLKLERGTGMECPEGRN